MVSERQKQARFYRDYIIQILGYYGRDNLGDDYFMPAIHELFSNDKFPGRSIIFNRPEEDLRKSDILILGGGDVIKRDYLKKIKPERPYYVLGAGLGYESEMDLIGPNMVEGYFRNRIDAAHGQQRKFKTKHCPDLAFVLPKPEPMGYHNMFAKKKKLAVIMANSAINPKIATSEMPDVHYLEYLKWEMARALDSLIEWYDIVFLPMSNNCYAWDDVMHKEVASRMVHGYKAKMDDTVWDANQFVRVIGDFDLVISMKFHGLIFSTIMGVPFVNVGISRKTRLFCRENALSELSIEPYCFSADRLFEKLKQAEKPGVSEKLLEIAQAKRDHWKVIAQAINSWIIPG